MDWNNDADSGAPKMSDEAAPVTRLRVCQRRACAPPLNFEGRGAATRGRGRAAQ